MAVESLILAVNPGSSSRKYALYSRDKLLVRLHFEHENNKIVCTVAPETRPIRLIHLLITLLMHRPKLIPIIKQSNAVKEVNIACIGLRVVAPTGLFLNDHILDDEILEKLRDLKARVPLHIGATLQESEHLQKSFEGVPIALISDSAFHSTKPDYCLELCDPS